MNPMTSIERKFKIGDRVLLSKWADGKKAHIVGIVVELSVFKPDGKKPLDFKEGLYGSFNCGVVWHNSKSATYHFENNLTLINHDPLWDGKEI